jgi:hypothetical protein
MTAYKPGKLNSEVSNFKIVGKDLNCFKERNRLAYLYLVNF